MSCPIRFCATGKSGLGHLRRITNIAEAIKRKWPQQPLQLITNAPVAGLSENERSFFSHIEIIPRNAMVSYLQQSPSCPVVVDTAVIPGLSGLSAPLCLILRETKTARIERFRLDMRRKWNLLIIPHPRLEWTLDREIIASEKIKNVGWIYRSHQLNGKPQILDFASTDRHTSAILIASGGGGGKTGADGFDKTVADLIRRTRHETNYPFHIVQAIGPRAADKAGIPGVNRTGASGPRLPDWFHHADIVISTAGYNSVLELAAIATPTLLMASQRTYDDQLQRALKWGPLLGAAHVSHEQSVAWLVQNIERPMQRLPVELMPSGADTAAHEIMCLGA